MDFQIFMALFHGIYVALYGCIWLDDADDSLDMENIWLIVNI